MSKSLLIMGTLSLLIALPNTAQANMPLHGTKAEASGTLNANQMNRFSTAQPYARINAALTIVNFNATAPYNEEYLEVSAPNSQPMAINIATDCTRVQQRFLDCFFNYPLSTADMATGNSTILIRYFAKKPGFEAYKSRNLTVGGTAGTIGSSGTGGVSAPIYTTIPNNVTIDTGFAPNLLATPRTYSPGSPNVNYSVSFSAVMPNPVSVQDYVSEVLRIQTPSGHNHYVNIANQCRRGGQGNSSVYCNGTLSLPAADANLQTMQLRADYFVNGIYPNAQAIWTGGATGYELLTSTGSTSGGTSGGNTSLCPDETAPMLPTTTTANGGFTFNFPPGSICPTEFFIDPPVSAGFDYVVTGTEFSEVTMPSLSVINDTDGYVVTYAGPGGSAINVPLQAGGNHVFVVPVSDFRLRGINPALALDPADQTAFPTGIVLKPTNQAVTVTQTPVTVNIAGSGVPIAVSGDFIDGTGQSGFTLDGTNSTDPDGDPLTYKWTQISGPILNIPTTNSAQVAMSVPASTAPGDVAVFELAVSDGTNSSRPDQVVVQIR